MRYHRAEARKGRTGRESLEGSAVRSEERQASGQRRLDWEETGARGLIAAGGTFARARGSPRPMGRRPNSKATSIVVRPRSFDFRTPVGPRLISSRKRSARSTSPPGGRDDHEHLGAPDLRRALFSAEEGEGWTARRGCTRGRLADFSWFDCRRQTPFFYVETGRRGCWENPQARSLRPEGRIDCSDFVGGRTSRCSKNFLLLVEEKGFRAGRARAPRGRSVERLMVRSEETAPSPWVELATDICALR